MSHIDRLAVVSRILLDERVIELRQENERLKLEVFWRDNSLFRLRRAMAIANCEQMKCMCDGCVIVGRTHSPYEDLRVDPNANINICRFAPWFYAQLLVHGFVVSDDDSDQSHHTPDSFGPLTRNECFDQDCHFVKLHFDKPVFGERLWKAKSVNDPELLKLSDFISFLEDFA